MHHIDVDTLSRDLRCVEREGTYKNSPVKLMRVFKPAEADQKGIEIKGWETFDEHPELVIFEGYVAQTGGAFLARKRPGV